MIDQHFTPPLLASLLVDSLPKEFIPSYIADFAVGEGSLIYAALKKWPRGVSVVANDLCKTTLDLLNEENWYKFNMNFLDSKLVSNSGLKSFENKIDFILLNPPFSQRHVKPIAWEGISCEITSGLALSFIYRSLAFLKPAGYLVAVVPNGCLTSQRDRKALNYLKKNYIFKVIAQNKEASFDKVKVKTSIILIENISPQALFLDSSCEKKPLKSKVFRGKLQMHIVSKKLDKDGFPLVHTTSLKNHKIEFLNTLYVTCPNSIVKGPAVLFPRVGNFNQDKVCILLPDVEVVISDCIFSIDCRSVEEAQVLKEIIHLNWKNFKENYSGTGAVYATLDKVDFFISDLYDKNIIKFNELAA